MRRDEEAQQRLAAASQSRSRPADSPMEEEITPEIESMNRHWARQMRAQAEADGPHIRQHFEKLRVWDKITGTSKRGLGLTSGLQRNTPVL